MKMMCFFLTITLLLGALALKPCPAQESKHYPNEVDASERPNTGMHNEFLTRDALADVQRFFESKKKPVDHFENISEGSEQGVKLIVKRATEGGPVIVTALNITTLKPKSPLDTFGPFGLLKQQIGKNGHTQAEYDALVKKYAKLAQAAGFLYMKTDKGYVANDSVIMEKYGRRVHGDMPSPSSQADLKARMQEMANKIQKLQAAGDMAGVMALSQEMQKAAMAGVSGPLAASASAIQDPWKIWVECLNELMKEAYWTRITYTSDFHWF